MCDEVWSNESIEDDDSATALAQAPRSAWRWQSGGLASRTLAKCLGDGGASSFFK